MEKNHQRRFEKNISDLEEHLKSTEKYSRILSDRLRACQAQLKGNLI
jgi:DNA-binding transcriptional regulator GbsR (MarR family)